MCRRRVVRFGAGIGAVLGFLFFVASAVAKTVECDAVDTLAKVGLRSVDTVTISADTSNRVCKFAVNGVAASSPPPNIVADAYRSIVWSNNAPGWMLGGDLNRVPLDAFAALLLAAGPDHDIGVMVSILADSDDELKRCVNALRRHARDSQQTTTHNGDFRCMSVVPSQGNTTAVTGPIQADFLEPGRVRFRPHLIVAVTRGAQWNVLITPVR